MRLEALIEKLNKLNNAHGDCEVVIYNGYNQQTTQILGPSDVFHDEGEDEIVIEIYVKQTNTKETKK